MKEQKTEKQNEKAQKEERRKKPTFKRNDWHKKIKLGKGVKKNQKWRGAKGIHSKVRLNRRGHPGRPRIGWGNKKEEKGTIQGLETTRIENTTMLTNIQKGQAIIIGHVGKKKREEIIQKATEKKLTILNKYKKTPEKNNATRT